jgi:hypothetical protein
LKIILDNGNTDVLPLHHAREETKMRQQYKVAKNPKDSKWYVVGNCGNGYWMPVSNPFTSKQDAERHISHQLKADSAARMELQAV